MGTAVQRDAGARGGRGEAQAAGGGVHPRRTAGEQQEEHHTNHSPQPEKHGVPVGCVLSGGCLPCFQVNAVREEIAEDEARFNHSPILSYTSHCRAAVPPRDCLLAISQRQIPPLRYWLSQNPQSALGDSGNPGVKSSILTGVDVRRG